MKPRNQGLKVSLMDIGSQENRLKRSDGVYCGNLWALRRINIMPLTLKMLYSRIRATNKKDYKDNPMEQICQENKIPFKDNGKVVTGEETKSIGSNQRLPLIEEEVLTNRQRLLKKLVEASDEGGYEKITIGGKSYVHVSQKELVELFGSSKAYVGQLIKGEVKRGTLEAVKCGRKNYIRVNKRKMDEKLRLKRGRVEEKPLIEGERIVTRCIHEFERVFPNSISDFKRPGFEWRSWIYRRIHALMNKFYKEAKSWEGAWSRFKEYIAEIVSRQWLMKKGFCLWWILKFETVESLFSGAWPDFIKKGAKGVVETVKGAVEEVVEIVVSKESQEKQIKGVKESEVSKRIRRGILNRLGSIVYRSYFGDKVSIRDELEHAHESEDGKVHRWIVISTKGNNFIRDKISGDIYRLEAMKRSVEEEIEESGLEYELKLNGEEVCIREYSEVNGEAEAGTKLREQEGDNLGIGEKNSGAGFIRSAQQIIDRIMGVAKGGRSGDNYISSG